MAQGMGYGGAGGGRLDVHVCGRAHMCVGIPNYALHTLYIRNVVLS